jgi:ACT domain-containing protein
MNASIIALIYLRYKSSKQVTKIYFRIKMKNKLTVISEYIKQNGVIMYAFNKRSVIFKRMILHKIPF